MVELRRPRSGSRESWGGRLVRQSLQDVGFHVEHRGTYLTEARPRVQRIHTLLVQSAWNVVTDPVFEDLSRPYPRAMQRRFRARRLMTMWHLRRASRVVCLTEALADLVRPLTAAEILVRPVPCTTDLPRLVTALPGRPQARWQNAVLVPGTVTWFKQPWKALPAVCALQETHPEPLTVVFAGTDDGSGASDYTSSLAEQHGINAEFLSLKRPQMVRAVRDARAVIVPSTLESLSLSLLEALYLSPLVLATGIAVHREAAGRTGRTPLWLENLGPENTFDGSAPAPPVDPTPAWLEVGRALGLRRT